MLRVNGAFNMHEEFVIRPARETDLPAILDLAKTANPGLTNLLPDEKLLDEKIQWSLKSFSQNVQAPVHELYFFVLEEVKAQKIIGSCGIFSQVGEEFYSFKVNREFVSSELLHIRRENLYLQLVNDYKNVSELGLLLIHKKFRKQGLGKFLSRSRYLFLADNLEKFNSHLIAEMRGKIDLWGRSVFWDAVGSRFIDIQFTEADYLSACNQKHFIAELLPHTPIPVSLLPESAQRVIGVAHPDTAAAVAVLQSEGFEYSHYVDIFDGGPTLEAVLKQVKTVAQSQRGQILSVNDTAPGLPCMMSFQGVEYRVCLGEVRCLADGSVEISSALAASLHCSAGDTVRYMLL
jgi:arginine N-succinyltransferase